MAHFLVFRLPAGVRASEYDGPFDPDEYLQVAGRSDALTVEIRSATKSGVFERSVVGRSPTAHEGTSPQVRVDVGSYNTMVYEHEVFSAASALPIVLHYIDCGGLPNELVARPFQR